VILNFIHYVFPYTEIVIHCYTTTDIKRLTPYPHQFIRFADNHA